MQKNIWGEISTENINGGISNINMFRFINSRMKLAAISLIFLFLVTPLAPVFAQVDTQDTTSIPSSSSDIPTDTADVPDSPVDTPSENTSEAVPKSTIGRDVTGDSSVATENNNAVEQTPSDQAVQTPTSNETVDNLPDNTKDSGNQTMNSIINPLNPDLDPNEGKSETKTIMPDIDPSTGALTYSYPILAPPGRASLSPNLSLTYNSQNLTEDSIVGAGWSIGGIPFIERINKNGTDTLYRNMQIKSSVSGELVEDTPGTFKPKIENGDFINYAYASSTNVFTAYDKAGTKYTYGGSAASRQDDPNDSTHVYEWMISEVRDTNDNFIKFEYYKDAGQIYPQTITYTGNGVTDGIFTVNFYRASRNYAVKSFKTAFLATTTYEIGAIVDKINGSTSTAYSLAYTTGQNGQRQLLSSVTQSGTDESGTTVSLPATTFDYQSNTLGAGDWQSTSVTPPSYTYYDPYLSSNRTVGGSLWDYGVEMGDLNGDSIPDVAISADPGCVNGCIQPRKNFLGPNFDQASQFDMPVRLHANNADEFNSYFLNDLNGDGLADVAGAGSSYINTGSGFSENASFAADY